MGAFAVKRPGAKEIQMDRLEPMPQPANKTRKLCVNAQRLSRELPQHIRQNPAVAEIFEFVQRIDAACERDERHAVVRAPDLRFELLARLQGFAETENGHDLVALETQRLPARSLLENQRQHPHADKVRTVDALEALGDHG